MFIVPVTRESHQLARLFDDTFERFFGNTRAPEGSTLRSPALDVAETDRGYTVLIDLPGVAKEDVKISIDGRQVSVQAKTQTQTQRSDEKKDGERVVYRERSLASYGRTFTLPAEVEQAEASAKLEHGVLTLALPKRGARTAAQLTVS